MRATLRVIVAVAACLGVTAAGQPPKVSLPLAAARADHQKSLDKAQAAHDDAVRAAIDEYKKQLTEALAAETKAGNLDAAVELRDELKRADEAAPPRAPTPPKAALRKALVGTRWNWNGVPMTLHADGYVRNADWEANRLVTRWEAVDRRTVVLVVEKGRARDYYAVLEVSEKLDEFGGYGFDGKRLKAAKRLP
jgi:hypothetical protein